MYFSDPVGDIHSSLVLQYTLDRQTLNTINPRRINTRHDKLLTDKHEGLQIQTITNIGHNITYDIFIFDLVQVLLFFIVIMSRFCRVYRLCVYCLSCLIFDCLGFVIAPSSYHRLCPGKQCQNSSSSLSKGFGSGQLFSIFLSLTF